MKKYKLHGKLCSKVSNYTYWSYHSNSWYRFIMWFLGNSLIVSKLTKYLFVFDSRCWNGAHKRVSNLWILWYANYDNFLHIHMNKFHRNYCISITSLEKAVISRRPLNVNYKPLRVIPPTFFIVFYILTMTNIFLFFGVSLRHFTFISISFLCRVLFE